MRNQTSRFLKIRVFSLVLILLIFKQLNPSAKAEPEGSFGFQFLFNTVDSTFFSISSFSNSQKTPKNNPPRWITFYTNEGRKCSHPINISLHRKLGPIRRITLMGTCGPPLAQIKDKAGKVIGVVIKSKKRYYFGPEVIYYLHEEEINQNN